MGLGSIKPPMEVVLGDISPGIKLSGREGDWSPLCSPEVKNACSCI
jgi:hypothetical protein